MLPFTHEQFVAVFAAYNTAVWPAPLLAYALGAVMLWRLVRTAPDSGRWIGLGLAAMWMWTGVGYHWVHFTAINKVAWVFGALFVVQGMQLAVAALQSRLSFSPWAHTKAWLGWGLLGYAALAYPLLGLAAGLRYPAMPMFGVTPCPLTIFTFGLFLLAASPVPRRLFVIPLLWSLVGGSAAFLLDVPQDWLLLFSGVATVAVLRGKRLQRVRPT